MQLPMHEGPTEIWAVLDIRAFPFIVGNSQEEVSWECPCSKSLGTGLHSRQVLNLLVRCGACSRVLETPHRGSGEPIPGQPVYLPPGKYLIGSSIDVTNKPVMMVGYEALLGYARETGRKLPGIHDPDLGPNISTLDADSLKTIADSLRSLLGDDYVRLSETDARGRKSHTPPARRHRVIELLEYADDTAEQFRNGQGQVILNADLLAESLSLLAASSRWRNHPAWPTLRSSLVSETEAPHTATLLTVASYLVDANNGVGIHVTPSHQNTTTADIWIEPDLNQRVDLEVKTPLALRAPGTPVLERHAVAIIERMLKKSSRQRRNTRTSLLVIGGYHMGTSYDTIVSVAKGILTLERRKWWGLAGIVIVDCTFEVGQSAGEGETYMAPVARFDIARNHGYRGDLSLQTEVEPTSAIPGLRPS